MTEEVCDTLEEVFIKIIEGMEEEGIDFKEEVGRFTMELDKRPDLHIEVYLVDKKTHEEFEKYDLVSDELM